MRGTLALLVLLGGCSFVLDDGTLAPDYDGYVRQRADLVADLDALIGDAEADAPAACRVVAVGHKACGGPAAFRIYSTVDSDAEAVEALADEITRLDTWANTEFGLASDCSVPVEPTPLVVNGRCQAGPAR